MTDTNRLPRRDVGGTHVRRDYIVRLFLLILLSHYESIVIDVRGANPNFSPSELTYQIAETKASILFVHHSPDCLDNALQAAKTANISMDQIILFDTLDHHPVTEGVAKFMSVSDLVRIGTENSNQPFIERRLSPGEARTKLAYLSLSSGTTGVPKAVAIPHYSVIANVVQMAVHNRVNDGEYWERRGEEARFRPGDVAIGVLPLYRKSFFYYHIPLISSKIFTAWWRTYVQ